MRRAPAVILSVYILCVCLLLTGCSFGSVYGNYVDIEHLLVVETVGVDLAADGKVTLTISTDKTGTDSNYQLSAEADTITKAKDILQTYLPKNELFFPHVSFIVVGESAARYGITGLMDFIIRSVETRIDTPMIVVRNGTAKDLITGIGGKDHDVSNSLRALQETVKKSCGKIIFSAADMALSLDDSGAALIFAVELEQSDKADATAKKGELTACPAGFGVFLGDKLAGFIPNSSSRGVGMLMNFNGSSNADVPVGNEFVSVSVDTGKCEITPVWGDDGRIQRIKVHVTAKGAIAEMQEPHNLSKAYLDEIDNSLCLLIKDWICSVLDISKSLGADFLSLGRKFEVSSANKYRSMPEPFSRQLKNMVFDVTVDAGVERSYDLTSPARSSMK